MSRIPKLIQPNGQPLYGIFPKGVEELNYLDFDLRTNMDKKRTLLAKKFGFNQFQFISLISPQLIVGVAIVDLKLVSNAFIYLYHVPTGKFSEYSFLQPLAHNTSIPTGANSGCAEFIKGKNRLLIDSRQAGLRQLTVDLPNKVKIQATIDEMSQYQPLAICSRAGYSGWVFTQKSAAHSCEGSVQWDDETFDLRTIHALAAVDWTGGYMRRDTFWNWGSLSCTLADGRRLGFNLAAGVNETGFSENALWLDGKLIKIDMVDFRFDRYNKESNWVLRSHDGKINLHFTPKGKRFDKTNALFMASNFTQYFGQYQGEIHLENETIQLDGQWGLTEDHYAKW